MSQIARIAIAVIAALATAGCSDSRGGTVYTADSGHSSGWLTAHGAKFLAEPINASGGLSKSNQCAQCHGTDLKGGISAVTCFNTGRNGRACHAGGPGAHVSATWDEPSEHGAAAKAAPSGIQGMFNCRKCHGGDLTGGLVGKSCYSCHTDTPHAPKPWRGAARRHTDVDEGNASACGGCHAGTFAGAKPETGSQARCFNGTLCHATPGGGSCYACHGTEGVNIAPPASLSGATGQSDPKVGAHQSHLTAKHGYSDTVACGECHTFPYSIDEPGHRDGDFIAEVPLAGKLATNNGASPSYGFTTGKCSNTYCHDGRNFPAKGSSGTDPAWNQTDYLTGAVADCSKCHGYPPSQNHPQKSDCSKCHLHVNSDNKSFSNPSRHINGYVDESVSSCYACHGTEGVNPAPPFDNSGLTDSAKVGAHQSHLLASSGYSNPVSCDQCHVVPASVESPAHRDGDYLAEVPLSGSIASANGSEGGYNFTTRACSGVYCHDGKRFKHGWSSGTDPVWNDTSYITGAVADCSKCHGYPPGGAHPADADCSKCHLHVTANNIGFSDATKHLNKTVEAVDGPCYACHGDVAVNNAPPNDLAGNTADTSLKVGAHQTHLQATDGMSAAVACAECHVVPAAVHDASHRDGDNTAEIIFGALATTNGASPSYNYGTRRCSNTYCHDGRNFKYGFSAGTDPVWNDTSYITGAVADCSKCHGYPPGNGHPRNSGCGSYNDGNGCHTNVNTDDTTFKNASLHVNGTVEVIGLPCRVCHGSTVNDAPPNDLNGDTSAADPEVGAHQAHLTAPSNYSSKIACAECHIVPEFGHVDDPTHIDGDVRAEVTFGAISKNNAAAPAYDYTLRKCSNTYCHDGGRFEHGWSTGTDPVWNDADYLNGTVADCSRCHGYPPGGGHANRADCNACHLHVNPDNRSFGDKTKHINGTVEAN